MPRTVWRLLGLFGRRGARLLLKWTNEQEVSVLRCAHRLSMSKVAQFSCRVHWMNQEAVVVQVMHKESGVSLFSIPADIPFGQVKVHVLLCSLITHTHQASHTHITHTHHTHTSQSHTLDCLWVTQLISHTVPADISSIFVYFVFSLYFGYWSCPRLQLLCRRTDRRMRGTVWRMWLECRLLWASRELSPSSVSRCDVV